MAKSSMMSVIGGAIAGALGISLLWNLLQRGNAAGPGSVVIHGAGNSGNRFYVDLVRDELAAAIAAHPETPAISDDELVKILTAIRERARKGNLQAALVLYRIAEMQRSSS